MAKAQLSSCSHSTLTSWVGCGASGGTSLGLSVVGEGSLPECPWSPHHAREAAPCIQ